MATKKEPPTPNPFVSQGFALIAQYQAAEARRDAKAAELEPFDKELAEIDKQITELREKLIGFGPGLYCDESGQLTARVVAGIVPEFGPDRFVLPPGKDEEARALAGDSFLTLFDRTVTHSPKKGFDALAKALLTKGKAAKIIALCIIPGRLGGGRAATIRWGK